MRVSILSGNRVLGFLALTTAMCSLASAASENSEPAMPPQPPVADRVGLFHYETKADFGLTVTKTGKHDDVVVKDVTFLASTIAADTRVSGAIVTPVESKHAAGILWVHWLGEPKTTNHTEFLDEAEALAKRGAVSLLVDAMWAKPDWYPERRLDDDFENSVAQVVELRRALDLLVHQPGVDPGRIAVVGHDYGAMYASLLAGIDHRPRTFVFIACTTSFNDWAFFHARPASMVDYLAENRPLQILDYVKAIKGASIFMQFAEEDRYVPMQKAFEYFAAAPSPRKMTVYNGAHHEMTTPAAVREDRTAWLVRELGLKPEQE